jgi:hypothetical protein
MILWKRDQTLEQCEFGQARNIADVELAHDPFAVSFDGSK